MRFNYSHFLLILLFIYGYSGFSEGTKEIMPSSTGVEKLLASSPTTSSFGFAYYSPTVPICPANNRLNIHIKEIGEKIYYGFNDNAGGGKYRIRDPNDQIVVLETAIPTAGTGYIGSYDADTAGPSQIVGVSGYTALSYTPQMTGDYYMEFYTNAAGGNPVTVLLDFFDVTVASAVDVAIPGRIWSKAWQFSTGSNPGTSTGKYFIYTDDGLVSSMGLNGLQGITFTVACNQVGCPVPFPGTGYTRNSVNGKYVTPQYKIFLNDPDFTVYPTGTLGELANVVVTWNCDGTADITFDVTQAGTVDVLLDINPATGQDAEDVLHSQPVGIGSNNYHWPGLNGLGAQVPNGTTFGIIVTYIMGLTNFPMYDVEQNANGLLINLIRPTGTAPLVYWDDTDLNKHGCTSTQNPTLPTANTTGCNASTSGCHTWLSVGGSTVNQCSYGNENTVNQYWYSVFYTAPTVTFIEHRYPGTPSFPIGAAQVCAGDEGVTYNISDEPNSTTYTWEYTGTGVTFNPPNPTGTTATLDFAGNATSGQIRVKGWNANCGSLDLYNSKAITVIPIPQLSNPQPPAICSGETFQTILQSTPTTNDFSWTVDCTPPGIFVSCPTGHLHTNSINDAVTITGTDPGTVTYHISPATSGCAGQPQDLVLEIKPLPDLITSPTTQSICSGEQTNIQLTSSLSDPTFSWTVPLVPPGITLSNVIVIPDKIVVTIDNINTYPVTVDFHIVPTANSCSSPYSVYQVVVKPKPYLTNLPHDPICSESTFNVPLTMDVENPQNPYYTWTASCNPTGSVTGFSTNLNTGISTINDVLTNTIHEPATVTYEITPYANDCQGVTASYSVIVNPAPHFTSPIQLPICSGTTFNVNLAMDVINPVNSYFEWTASCTPVGGAGGYPPGLVTGSSISDVLTNNINADATVIYNITPFANNCEGQSSDYPVIIHPVASLNPLTPQSPQIICSGEPTQPVALSTDILSPLVVDYNYTVVCEPGIPVCPPDGPDNPIPATAISNTLLSPNNVTYTIVPSVDGCDGTPSTYQIQVNPSPTITTTPLSQQICSGTQSAAVELSANVAGITTYEWIATPSSPDITGYLAGTSTGDIPVQTISNSATTQGYVNYHIIPSSQSGMSCPGAPADYKIYVNPLPEPLIDGPPQVCYDQSGTIYSTPIVVNHDYQWTVTGAISYTGNNTNSITVDWGPGPSGIVELTEVDLSFSTNCSTVATARNIIINPAPTPSFLQANGEVCQGTSGVVYATEAGMSDYVWTVSAGGMITAGGTPASPSVTVSWISAGPQSVSVNYTNLKGCSAVNATNYPVTVNPLPVSTITEAIGPVCQSQAHVYNTPFDAASAFTWSPAGNVVSGQGTNSASFIWPASGPATVSVMGTNTLTNCKSSSVYSTTVNPTPAPLFTPCFDLRTTPNANKITLRGGTPYLPVQGVYSGSRVTLNPVSGNYEFDPAGAAIGSYPIAYKYTNTFNCSASASSVTIQVVNSSLICGDSLTDVRDGTKYKTSLIGGRCWMQQNLRYGSTLVLTSEPQTDNCVSEKYCLPTDVTCKSYGGLYQWDEVMAYSSTALNQGLCPPEWHVPSEIEWQSMITDISAGITPPDGVAGSFLRDTFLDPGGFFALTKGLYYLSNSWAFTSGQLTGAMFWTATPAGADRSIARGVNSINLSTSKYSGSRNNAFSVRCVKD